MVRVLIVADEQDVRRILAETAEEFGYHVSVATTVAEAFRSLKAVRPDAIVLDMVLPDAAGQVGLDRLKTLRPDVPVVMLTGDADERLARQTLKRGAFGYVKKPFNVDQLERVLNAALGASGALRNR